MAININPYLVYILEGIIFLLLDLIIARVVISLGDFILAKIDEIPISWSEVWKDNSAGFKKNWEMLMVLWPLVVVVIISGAMLLGGRYILRYSKIILRIPHSPSHSS